MADEESSYLEHQRDVFERDVPDVLAHAVEGHYSGNISAQLIEKNEPGFGANELIWTIAVEGISSR